MEKLFMYNMRNTPKAQQSLPSRRGFLFNNFKNSRQSITA